MFNLITRTGYTSTMTMRTYNVYCPLFVFSETGKDKQ